MTISNGRYDVGQRKYGEGGYGDENGGNSSIGTQLNESYYKKKALIEATKEQYFQQLADTTAMPKHYGKTIKQYHYLPLLDDRNLNDQGIDAAGNRSTDTTVTVTISGFSRVGGFGSQYVVGTTDADGDVKSETGTEHVTAKVTNPELMTESSFSATNSDPATASDQAWAKALYTFTNRGQTNASSISNFKLECYAYETNGANGWDGVTEYKFSSYERSTTASGNLYGSSKDVGTISGKLPVLSEHGGRVNRVGFKRIVIEGQIEKFGFFDEYTQESLDFDTDEELEMHVNREMVRAANEITEDTLQIDLLNGAGVVYYTGTATSAAEVEEEVTYDDLVRLAIELNNNRTPKQTRVITGSRMIDTRVVSGGYVMYVGAEILPTLKQMVDYFGEKAFIETKHYAAAGDILRGEVGSIDQFRIVVVPEMMHWDGAGAAVTVDPDNSHLQNDGSNLNLFPMLVVGDGSFTTIGFQTSGDSVKFKTIHKKPGMSQAHHHDPYGETGFMSIKWWYGTMILRPERLALIKTVARW